MRQVTLTLSESDEMIVRKATANSGKSTEDWLTDRVATVLKGQHTANLKSELTELAKGARQAIAVGAYENLHEFVVRYNLTDRITEFGGINKFYILCNSVSSRAPYLQESQIHA